MGYRKHGALDKGAIVLPGVIREGVHWWVSNFDRERLFKWRNKYRQRWERRGELKFREGWVALSVDTEKL